MWLKRLLKLNQSVQNFGTGPGGGAGGGMDAGGTKTFPGMGGLFEGGAPLSKEELYNKEQRNRRRKLRNRHRKWLSSKDRHHNQ